MEDVEERVADEGDLNKGLGVEGVRDLLRALAQIHAQSLKNSDWTMLVTEHTPFFYEQTAIFINKVASQWSVLDENKVQVCPTKLPSSQH